MIAVIADDITGAAEIGGIAFCHGISSEVQTTFHHVTDVGMIVIDSDTRSDGVADATAKVQAATRDLLTARPDWFYKKTDSALRGNILAEISTMMEASGLGRCLLAPANPAIGRTVENGHYFINGIPLHSTDFASDPEYPAVTSDVIALLAKGRQVDIRLLPPGSPVPGVGISIGEVRTGHDMRSWGRAVTRDVLPAGGGAFFSAILDAKGRYRSDIPPLPRVGTRLFICGSSTDVSRRSLAEARASGLAVHAMPEGLFEGRTGASEISQWAGDVVSSLHQRGITVAAVDRLVVKDSSFALRLRQHTAELTEHILALFDVNDLYIEGGATAAAIMARLGWTRLRPVTQLAHGVVTMKVMERPGMLLTVKPGSFAWPANIWRQL